MIFVNCVIPAKDREYLTYRASWQTEPTMSRHHSSQAFTTPGTMAAA
jgi:hypothetical protein